MAHQFPDPMIEYIDEIAALMGWVSHPKYADHIWCKVYQAGRVNFQVTNEVTFKLSVTAWAYTPSGSVSFGKTTFNLGRKPSDAAASIKQRLMPQVAEGLEALTKKETDLVARMATLQETVAPLMAAGFSVKIEKEGTIDQRAVVDYRGPAGSMSATIYGSGSVYLERINLNSDVPAAETLLKLATALG